jgi:hypothetical protein
MLAGIFRIQLKMFKPIFPSSILLYYKAGFSKDFFCRGNSKCLGCGGQESVTTMGSGKAASDKI